MNNKNIAKTVDRACHSCEILQQMTTIGRSAISLTNLSLPRSPMYDQPNYLDSENEPYYIYSDIRDWVRQTLERDL